VEIHRFDVNERASGVSVFNGVAYFSAVPTRPYGAEKSAAEQFTETLKHVEHRLSFVGSNRSDVIYVQIFIAKPEYFHEINEVWDKWIDMDSRPSRICKVLIFQNPAMKVEVVVTARARNHPPGT
jgi:enamine deaminase RidA (YjgF/YER057c/UK114 family)